MKLRKLNIILQLCFGIVSCYSDSDTLKQGQQLQDGEFLVSAGKVFTLGFFSLEEERTIGYFNPESAQKRFIGIWYTDSPGRRPVWIANRNNPVYRATGVLEIDKSGDLKISDSNGQTSVMLCSKTQGTVRTVAATLTDAGNFLLREVLSDGLAGSKILWQSFDHPTDTLLPGMRLGFDFKTGKNWSLTSWVSSKVPALGPYTLGLDRNGTNQLILWRRGEIQWKSGSLNEGKFLNLEDYLYSFEIVSNENERYYVLSAMKTWYVNFPMYQIGELGSINSVNIAQSDPYQESQRSRGSPLSGVVDCKRIRTATGCVEHKLPECRSKVWFDSTKGYVKSDGIRYEKGRGGDILGLDDCEAMCLKKCSCVAYASIYSNGTGCEFWSNMTQLVEDRYDHDYRDFYLQRNKPSMTDIRRKNVIWIWLIVSTSIFIVVLVVAWLGYRMKRMLLAAARFLGLLGCFLRHRLRSNLSKYYDHIQQKVETVNMQTGGKTHSDMDSRAGYSGKSRKKRTLTLAFGKKTQGIRVFRFESVARATNNFALSNVLGQGGYGTVYKGLLADGQEIAIKRLSKTSKQGKSEFMNELKLVAKLQHTNLVKLIGCCIEQEEKIVVYEFMPNKSLDFFIFDESRRLLLDWTQRVNIIEGIAQGLLYLHKYSRLKIIHRDLKSGNILLDEEMNPKISDFGMAKLFEQNESRANTKIVVGTPGYMPPEYALDGYFSVKTDVFSFGVLLLEIISSKKNNGTYSPDRHLNLIGYAWELWRENRGLEFIDNTLILNDREQQDAMKCINLGLLCVQENASDRPTMSTVVTMINNEASQLPIPKKPAFFFGNYASQAERLQCDLEQGSLNEASVSEMEAR
ncbi:G-type lectin S-receptor-like serine/threonine-protein kinase CES101 [Silene latifolia]|uniref:G-type lectin S-receptor-like serine/threonine-protein kinase CES101 n=1 Tax=Silene latifolia TaxID=37657 RepID=UPI003D777D2C